MITAARAQNTDARKVRADRIMDAASELLLKWGYKRVTIDDVAARAGIGKGTVYLHWKTREELFYSVIMREQASATDEIIAAAKKDPREVLLHRLTRLKYLTMMKSPILRAVFEGDPDIVGRLVTTARDSSLSALQGLVSSEYFQLLFDNKLTRPDLSLEELIYGVGAMSLGFFTGDAFLSVLGASPSLERRADVLESAIERAFSAPPTDEALRRIAPAVVQIYENARKLSQEYLKKAYEVRSH
jgi:AcrR family transcriptional regulator